MLLTEEPGFFGRLRERSVGPARQLLSTAQIRRNPQGLPKLAIGSVAFDQQRRGGQEGCRFISAATRWNSCTGERGSDPGAAHLPVLRDVRTGDPNGDREVAVRGSREGAAMASVPPRSPTVAIALRGVPRCAVPPWRHRIPVWLRFSGADTQSVNDLADYKLRRADGTAVPLLAMVSVPHAGGGIGHPAREPPDVHGDRRQSGRGTTPEVARKAIEAAMKSVSLPAGYKWSFGQGFDDDDKAGQQMMNNTLLAFGAGLCGHVRHVRIAAVPSGNPQHLRVFRVRGVLVLLADRQHVFHHGVPSAS